MARKDEIGRWGEEIAVGFVEQLGYTIVERNWRHTMGEIDVIARDVDQTVFIEVKTRSGRGYGHPFEAITTEKLARLRRLALAWCRAQEHPPTRIRLDAVAVLGRPDRGAQVEHLMGVF
ncbi:YraN family protein [Klugiella xanthotipulae]|uniref:UPF0102 protein FB466_2008 n=1 Tax=Klugiella xanthotipulae TaxID=244735 RepID=A0A543HS37_9MICO|nr:YraN family protein [Klugiella xanthotipulae]TQM61079.1 putative endonuclease [Klugiella xanthotipulae]